MEKIKAAELLSSLGIPALSDDDLEMVTGGSSEGLNLGEEWTGVNQCKSEANKQYNQCTEECWFANDPVDCLSGCDMDKNDAMTECDAL